MSHYTIRAGHSLRDSDGSVKTGGMLIELDDDSAARLHDQVEPAPADTHAPAADPAPAEPQA